MNGAATLDQAMADHWGRLLGLLIRRHRRPDVAEEALAEAFAAAARAWPEGGAPADPPAWLYTVASRRLIDALRGEATRAARPTPAPPALGGSPSYPGDAVDDRLALLFMCTHPALAAEVRPALALRFVIGVPTEIIARLFLVSQATMAARLTRAKRRLATSGIPFAVPPPPQWAPRVDGVARAIYLAFTAGYAPSTGPDVVRTDEADGAVRLALLSVELMPDQAVLQALASLLQLQHARRDARVDGAGRLVVLEHQDRQRWHHGEIRAGVARLAAIEPTAGLAEELRLQAAIAAVHCSAGIYADTDWSAIADHYRALEALTGSPIVRLNRAVAVAEVDGADAGLALLDGLDQALPGHHRVALVRAELLRRAGRHEAARVSYLAAVDACPAPAELAHIRRRLASLDEQAPPPAG